MTHLGEQVSALVDGELDHDARDRALAHLTGCAECRAEVDAERRAKARLGQLADPVMPFEVTARLSALHAELSAVGQGSSTWRTENTSTWRTEHTPRWPRRTRRRGSTIHRRRLAAATTGV